ncbi:pentapeptide repeat-containing protein [Campylobacter coli]|nr:pentapeptide repeat-containing protein [Campylobacter coli]EHD2721276.1 pentapeptide repeat-containing protein [Campylobacter coli]
MEVFDEELVSYGIFVKHARKSIEKEKISVSGNVEIETINIETLQKKGIKCLDIKSKKIKNITFVKDISLDMFFSGVTFTDEIKTNSKFTGELDFSGCTFKEEVNFQQANFENFLCSDTIFEKQVSFLNTVFGNEKIISFSDVKFLNSANFTNAIFNQKTNFEKVYFYDTLLFNRAEFKFDITLNIECKKEAHFINAFAKKMTIYNSTFEKSLDLDITFTLLEILKIKILENLNLHQSEGVKVSMASSIVYGVTNFSFANIKTIFLTSLTFKEEIHLYIYNLKKMQNINFEDITFGKLFLQKELFEKSVNFERCIFLQDVNFKDYTFNEITFNTCTFKESAYFNNSNFTKGVDFHESEFEKTACFYGVKFDETPNFSQALFKGNINIINSNLNFDFTKLDKKIILLSSQGEGKYDYEIANDFRDSFRTFKNALIKDSNLLDASNFHKYELYCKEIELKNKKDKTLKDRIDKWQLFFYHKLCDHHTDILQSLNSVILVIGIFVLSSVVMVAIFNYCLGYKPILEHWYFSLDFYNHHINSIIQDNYLFVVKVNFAMLFTYLILVGFALCLKYIREFFIIISYAITLLVLVVSPKILIPAMGFFTDKRAMLDPLSTIGGIYTIVFGFVVFSFIKTIRKNSIVPS